MFGTLRSLAVAALAKIRRQPVETPRYNGPAIPVRSRLMRTLSANQLRGRAFVLHANGGRKLRTQGQRDRSLKIRSNRRKAAAKAHARRAAALLLFTGLYMAKPATVNAQTVTVSASNLYDGNTPANGTISFAPVLANGTAASYRYPSGGQRTVGVYTATVTNGAFTITLPDTSQTNPQNLCFNVVLTGTRNRLGPGYSCVQPAANNTWCSSGVCNFDNYVPNEAALVVEQTGPQGPAGPAGPGGPASYTFSVSGGTTKAINDATGNTDYSGADAAVVINDVLNATVNTGGTLYFRPGTYNLNSCTLETLYSGYANTCYAVGIPSTQSATNFPSFRFVGESAMSGSQNLPATSGVIFNVTSTAVTAAGSNLLVGFWMRPNMTCDAYYTDTCLYWNDHIEFDNIVIQFPNSTRGSEDAINVLEASFLSVKDSTFGFVTAPSSPGTAGTYGLTAIVGPSTPSDGERLVNTEVMPGWDIGYSVNTEHSLLQYPMAYHNRIGFTYGALHARNIYPIVNSSLWNHAHCYITIHCIVMGPSNNFNSANVQLDLLNLQIEGGTDAWAFVDGITTVPAVGGLITWEGNVNSTPGISLFAPGSGQNYVSETNGSLLADGVVDGKIPTASVTASSCALGVSSGCLPYKTGAADNVNATPSTAVSFSLPAPTAGEHYCVSNGYNGTAANTGVLTVFGAGLGVLDNGSFFPSISSAGAAGDRACFTATNSSYWTADRPFQGTWTGGTPTVSYVQLFGDFSGNTNETSFAVNGTVTAGNLLVCHADWVQASGTDQTISSLSDGTSNMTALTLASEGSGAFARSQDFYLLAANGGSKTFTATFTGAVNYPKIDCMELHTSSGTWHYDVNSAASASSASANTGAITTTKASDVLVYFNSINAVVATLSSPLIGALTPTEPSSSPMFTNDHVYYATPGTILTGAGTGTYSTTTDWTASMDAFYAQ